MAKKDDIEFLKSFLQKLKESYATIEELCPNDLLPADKPLHESDEEERVARLADDHGLDGNLFRNLYQSKSASDADDLRSMRKRCCRQIEIMPRLIRAVETSPNRPTSDIESEAMRLVLATGDENAIRAMAIIDNGETTERRMCDLLVLDRRYAAYDSVQWARMLGVKGGAVRKTTTWKALQKHKNGQAENLSDLLPPPQGSQ